MQSNAKLRENILRACGKELKGHRAIGELAKILWEEEVIEKIISGFVGQNYESFLVATDSRVIIVGKSSWMGLVKADDFAYDKISSIQHKVGFGFCDVKITSSGNKAEISISDKGKGVEIAEYIKRKANNVNSGKNTSNNGQDIVSQLERMAKLKEQGIISEAEFDAMKQKLLK